MANLTPAERGRLGGLKTLERYGTEHFSRIGEMGARERLRHYRPIPVGTSDFIWVKREVPLTDEQLDGYYKKGENHA